MLIETIVIYKNVNKNLIDLTTRFNLVSALISLLLSTWVWHYSQCNQFCNTGHIDSEISQWKGKDWFNIALRPCLPFKQF